MVKIKIRKGDTVIIRSGNEKGSIGEVLKVIPDKNRVLIKGINIVKRHVKPSQNSSGGIVHEERPLHISKVAFCYNGKPVRLGFKIYENGEKKRIEKKTNYVV